MSVYTTFDTSHYDDWTTIVNLLRDHTTVIFIHVASNKAWAFLAAKELGVALLHTGLPILTATSIAADYPDAVYLNNEPSFA